MKRKVAPQIQHNSEPESNNSRVWFLSIIGIASLLIILQTFGIFKSFDQSSTTGWIDMKSDEYMNKPMPKRAAEKPTPQVEATLQEIADEFEGPVFSDIRTANTEKGWGLTNDEAKFYDDMREHYAGNVNNWLGVVKKSYSTYKVVKDIFGGNENASGVLQNQQSASTIYTELSKKFGISPTESLNFAQSGQGHQLSDWANFVEKNKKK